MHKLGELTFDPILANSSNDQQMENFIFLRYFIVFTQCQIRAGGILPPVIASLHCVQCEIVL